MLYSDVNELKIVLGINPNNKAEDKAIALYLEHASSWIEEFINRPGMSYSSRTEFYRGTGTQKLLLRSRPVWPLPNTPNQISVIVDESGYWGSTPGSFGTGDSTSEPLVYGTDFAVWGLDDGKSSRSGILYRINDLWPKPMQRQQGFLAPFIGEGNGSVQVSYFGGHTVDTLPAAFRLACNLLIARMRFIFPIGAELSASSLEDANFSIINGKQKLLELVNPILWNYRNWKW